MVGESLLLLFDQTHPCWTEELVVAAGEDPEELGALLCAGLLRREGPCWQLTEEGARIFRPLARESFLQAEPGWPVENPSLWLRRNRLERALDRAFLGRWGGKEFRPGEELPFFPDLPQEALRFQGDMPHLDPLAQEKVTSLLEEVFPAMRHQAKKGGTFRERQEILVERGIKEGAFEVDLLFLHRYDLALYQHLPRPEGDRLGLYQTDRFLFRLAGELETLSALAVGEDLTRLHLFLEGQRSLFLPREYDQDSDGFDDVTWWLWVTEAESEARRLAKALEPAARAFEPLAKPVELWTISMESLMGVTATEESHWDLFAERAHPLNRP